MEMIQTTISGMDAVTSSSNDTALDERAAADVSDAVVSSEEDLDDGGDGIVTGSNVGEDSGACEWVGICREIKWRNTGLRVAGRGEKSICSAENTTSQRCRNLVGSSCSIT
eukprot:TRINITY_DN4422_c0_g2_i1.p2 TRINITY_DN4422_c0_g2~~TRINITY_DN4422_c0_g2_i1.p2  ORF type:complete len:111 (+),score=11.32 TRINITY_DN4422_c0_g2_i1:245-577(+)